MKPRARRVTLAAAVLGIGIVAVLVVAHWGTVRDHAEGWVFLLTTETLTIRPGPDAPTKDSKVAEVAGRSRDFHTVIILLDSLAYRSDLPVIFDAKCDWSPYSGPTGVFADEKLRAIGWRLVELQRPHVIIVYAPTRP